MIGFLNLAMLAGLAGLALPVLAHLLSKRKFDVVEWGAMQFLELGQRTRRRIRLEEFLLLLLRMGLILLIVLALARPWLAGSLFAVVDRGPACDTVFILDGSYSMGWEGRLTTPHGEGMQWVHRYLERLGGGDTAGLIDARDIPRPAVDPLTADLTLLRNRLDDLPEPSGSANLPAAIRSATRMLTGATNLKRDIIIVSDGQALPWRLEEPFLWNRIDTVLNEAAVRPRIWLVNLDQQLPADRTNFSVERLQLSREFTVPQFTVRIRTTIRQSQGNATRRQVYFEVNGQRLENKTLSVNLPPDGEAAVEFDHRFDEPGSYVVSVVLDGDQLPGDNRADAAVQIDNGIPVLLVEGRPDAAPLERSTFYVRSALMPTGVDSPWVNARVISPDRLTAEELAGQTAVFLCDVPRLTQAQAEALQEFVAGGGGLVIAPGASVDPSAWNPYYREGQGWLPAGLNSIRDESAVEGDTVTIDNDSLQQPWITMFRKDQPEDGFDFTSVRFARWWELTVDSPPADEAGREAPSPAGSPVVAARLSSGDPAILTRSRERGSVALLAVPLDDSWSTLTGRRALAPLVHELVFLMAGQHSGRNVDVGTPLVLNLDSASATQSRWVFTLPDGSTRAASAAGDELRPAVQLSETSLPGLYEARPADAPAASAQKFVVNFDRSESDLTPLTPEQRAWIEGDDRIRSVPDLEALVAAQAEEAPRAEIWSFLIVLVLGLLVFEVFMTRRLLKGGYEVASEDA